MSLDGFNKTHCDKCKEKVERGDGIYAEHGSIIKILAMNKSDKNTSTTTNGMNTRRPTR